MFYMASIHGKQNWLLGGLLIATLGQSAMAQNYSWTQVGLTGSYRNPNAWTPNGIPDSMEATAIFGLPQQTFVGMIDDRELGDLIIANGADIHFSPAGIDPPDKLLTVHNLIDINRAKLSLGPLGISPSAVDIVGGDLQMDDGELHIKDGARLIGTEARIATDANLLSSSIIVEGNTGGSAATASRLILDEMVLGERGAVAMEVKDGAWVAASRIEMARHPSSFSSLKVTDELFDGYHSFVAANMDFGAGEARVDVLFGGALHSEGATLGSHGTSNTVIGIAGSGDGSRSLWDVDGPLTIANAGTGRLRVSSAGELRTRGAVVGAMPGGIGNVAVTSEYQGQVATWHNAGDMAIGGTSDQAGGYGTVWASQGGRMQVDGKITVWSSGILYLNEGHLSADWVDRSHGGEVTLVSGELVANRFTGDLTNESATLTIGHVDGNVQNTSGTLSPGLPIGQTTITGDYDHGLSAILDVQLGGISTGDYDVVEVYGAANLDGSLSVEIVSGFVPRNTDEFEIVKSGDLGGFFSNLALGDRIATDGGEGSFRVRYGSGRVILSDFMEIVDIDFNRDGAADCLDINALTSEIAGGTHSVGVRPEWRRRRGS